MSEFIDTKKYLDKQGIKYIEANGELVSKCPFCDKDKHFYTSIKKGLYTCHRCGETGNMTTLAKHLGDDIKNVFQNKGGQIY